MNAEKIAQSKMFDGKLAKSRREPEKQPGIEDWKHRLKRNGSNPRPPKICRRIAEPEEKERKENEQNS